MLEADADPAGQALQGEEEAEMDSRDLKAEVVRLTLELQEATEEKLQAARYGLVVLEESAALKMKNRQLEEEHEILKGELQQLKEVGPPVRKQWAGKFTFPATQCVCFYNKLNMVTWSETGISLHSYFSSIVK